MTYPKFKTCASMFRSLPIIPESCHEQGALGAASINKIKAEIRGASMGLIKSQCVAGKLMNSVESWRKAGARIGPIFSKPISIMQCAAPARYIYKAAAAAPRLKIAGFDEYQVALDSKATHNPAVRGV